MKYKKIITSGCSFTEGLTWSEYLNNHLDKNNINVNFSNVSLRAQGNDLIQKKAIYAIRHAMDYEKFKPEEIAVFIMWSGTERRGLYIDNPDLVDKILRKEQHRHTGMNPFLALDNTRKSDSGWLLTNSLGSGNDIINLDFYRLSLSDSHSAHYSLENILHLQYFCKLFNIKLYEMFYMSYVSEIIEKEADHPIVNYMYRDYDKSNLINPSIFEYLKDRERETGTELFRFDQHPNSLGQRIYFENIVLTKLTEQGFFKD